jgi:hypothetical protein
VLAPLALLVAGAAGAAAALPSADPAAGQAWLAPSAATLPAGSVEVASRLFLVGASYGVTDRVEVGAAVFPLSLDRGRAYRVSARGALLAHRRGGLAVTGDLFGYGSATAWRWWTSAVGLAGGLCLLEGCDTVVGAHWAPAFVAGRFTGEHLLSASVVQRVATGVKVMLEANHGLRAVQPDLVAGTVYWYGLRLHGRRLAVDLGLMFGSDLLFGAPWASVSYRFDGARGSAGVAGGEPTSSTRPSTKDLP